jgi:NADH-quinone oxidoreductase subunit M
MLWLIQRLFYGPESSLATSKPATDLYFGELAILWSFAVLMLVMGIAPAAWITTIETRSGPPTLKTSAPPMQAGQSAALSEGSQP